MVRINNDTMTLPRLRHHRSKFSLPLKLLLCLLAFSLLLVAFSIKSLQAAQDNILPPGLRRISQQQIVIGYAVSVTGCGSDPITEGAAVLKHSIHLAHSRSPRRYGYQMYAIVHPNATSCAAPLADLGYTLLSRETPVALQDIRGDFLREKIHTNGCCGEKELIKLEAYTLVQHPLIVHLDLDTLILKPLDPIFNVMLMNNATTVHPTSVDAMWPETPLPSRIDAVFTRDYNMVNPSTRYKPVQGGFLVLRPSWETYHEFVDIVKEGDFRQGKGWGGEVGPFYGSMTFQGLIPYYYDYLHPGNTLELNRCVYNQMCDNPRDKPTVKDVVHGNCRDGRQDCEDCRSRPVSDVATTHFTLCQKPWGCLPQDQDMIQHRLCRKLHHEWFRIRSQLEQSWGRSGYGTGTFQKDHFYGYCNKAGQPGYIPIQVPAGLENNLRKRELLH